MRVLAIETSCDETSAAVIEDGCVLSNPVASQVKLHSEYGGVVPELAAREHLINLIPVAREALSRANVTPAQIDAVAATRGPGLPTALLIGFQAAQAFAFALNRPFLGIHHHEAHLYSPWIGGQPPRAQFDSFLPNVSLIVSGGHTLLVHCLAELQHKVLGGTVDDAAGECFDKIAKLMGLPYPGGPQLDRLAEQGNPAAFDFPRPLLNDPEPNFSFSGLKTSVRYFLRDRPDILHSEQGRADVCASARAAIVDVLVAKTLRTAKRLTVPCITASGGVTCNLGLRRDLTAGCAKAGLELRLAERTFCTDNAAMIGILAERKFLQGAHSTELNAEVVPNWGLEAARSPRL